MIPLTILDVTGLQLVEKDTFNIQQGEVKTLIARGDKRDVFYVEGGATRINIKELVALEKQGKINLTKC